ncbi:MAG: sterol desaturase family protein [Burkholderiales bacterium]|jgi:sterol desaturase/sphingolipid hydroxylase (fatty acid hydroxylase superfamily)|nr:sterol desaturase family protein [Burkholderiales bacterium]
MDRIGLIFCVALAFLALERLAPGRDLPQSRGWHARAALLNAAQLGIVLLGGLTWSAWLQGPSLFHLAGTMPAPAQGFVCWFAGTFCFYWWHRARHESDFLWRTLHQIHHSASRIETLTSFYKHPLEIALNSLLSSAIVFVVLGASLEGGAWYSFFAALGEFYYHMNVRTPRWTGWFLQRPEHHSIHHQLDVHRHNYGDITWWDRIFGTFREAGEFAPQCGYRGEREQLLGRMLAFGDVNDKPTVSDR